MVDCSSSRRLESGATAGNCRYTSQGFSLLELLLAAALGIVMIAAVVQLFAGSSRGNVVLGGQARLQESARHAFALLSRSARAAGYLGCGGRDRLVNGLRGGWRQVVEFDVSVLVEGFDATVGIRNLGRFRLSVAERGSPSGGGTALIRTNFTRAAISSCFAAWRPRDDRSREGFRRPWIP